MKLPRASERAIQIAIKNRLALHGVVALHVPNEGRRSVVAGRRLRDEGMIAGAPDLICICPDGRTAWLEVKAPGGRVSERQAEFHALLQRLGHRIAVVTDQDQAVSRLREWGYIT
jgi:hypothetical protein